MEKKNRRCRNANSCENGQKIIILNYAKHTLSFLSIDHSCTQAYSPQQNGICERFHKTIGQEFYNVAFRTKIYKSIEELQMDLDKWLEEYNKDRTHQGKFCNCRTPMECFLQEKNKAQIKMIGYNISDNLEKSDTIVEKQMTVTKKELEKINSFSMAKK